MSIRVSIEGASTDRRVIALHRCTSFAWTQTQSNRVQAYNMPGVESEEAMDSSTSSGNSIESLKNFERALGHIRNSVRPMMFMSRDEVGTCLSPAERAKHNLQLAYGISSLYYMFLRTQGVAPATHPVKNKLDDIRGFFAKLKQAGKPPEQRKLKVDKEATRRFIDNALSGDRVWKNAQGFTGRQEGEWNSVKGIGRSMPAGQPEGHQYHQHDGRKQPAVASQGERGPTHDKQALPSAATSLPSSSPSSTSSTSQASLGKRKHVADTKGEGDGVDDKSNEEDDREARNSTSSNSSTGSSTAGRETRKPPKGPQKASKVKSKESALVPKESGTKHDVGRKNRKRAKK